MKLLEEFLKKHGMENMEGIIFVILQFPVDKMTAHEIFVHI